MWLSQRGCLSNWRKLRIYSNAQLVGFPCHETNAEKDKEISYTMWHSLLLIPNRVDVNYLHAVCYSGRTNPRQTRTYRIFRWNCCASSLQRNKHVKVTSTCTWGEKPVWPFHLKDEAYRCSQLLSTLAEIEGFHLCAEPF